VICAAILVAALLCCPTSLPAALTETRTWTSTSKAKITATLEKVEGGNAVFKKEDGNLVRLPVSRLHPKDRAFIVSVTPRTWLGKSGKSIKGAYLNHKSEDKIVIKLEDGTTGIVTVSRLLEADRAYLEIHRERVWKSRPGHEMTARFLFIRGGYVHLMKQDDDIVMMMLNKFSEEDMKLLKAAEKLEQFFEAVDAARKYHDSEKWDLALRECDKAEAACSRDERLSAVREEAEKHAGPAKTMKIKVGPKVEGEGDELMEFVWIKPGKFIMGFGEQKEFETRVNEETGEKELWSNLSDPWAGYSLPVHEVTISRGFYMGKFEVTRGQFAVFAKETGYKTQAEQNGQAMGGTKHGDWVVKKGASWRALAIFEQEDDHPVSAICWHDAMAFCDWLAKETKKDIRLPTEAEWEYACRAGTQTQWASGSWPPKDHLHSISWHMADYVPGWEPACGTKPVGSHKPNRWGLYDMHGNVYEWCLDYYRLYKDDKPVTDPYCKDFPGIQYYHKIYGHDPMHGKTKTYFHWACHRHGNGRRVLRGGGWCSQAPGNRSGFRRHEKGTNGLWYFGLRVVIAPTPEHN
jgi:formylglycine-generating enzyme required for sulfatase activity